MTRKDLAQLDPENQRIVRIVRNLAVALIGSVLFLGAVIAVVTWRGENTRSIVTRVSECERDPKGEECQRIRREAERGETVRQLCHRFWRVGYLCPKPGSRAAHREVVAGSGESPFGQPPPGSSPGGKAVGPRGDGGDVAPRRPRDHKQRTPSPPVSTSSPTPAPQPGDSANGASEEHGLDVCVDVVVSACVKAETPRLLP